MSGPQNARHVTHTHVRENGAAVSRDIPDGTIPTSNENVPQRDENRESFKIVKRRRRQRQKAVFGTGSDDVIRSGMKRIDLFEFRVDKERTKEELKNFELNTF